MNSRTLILYALLFIPIILVWWVQSRVRWVFQEEDQFANSGHVNGLEAARALLDQAGLHHIQLRIQGRFASDYYDPVEKVLVLSPRTARRASLLAVGIAGHEVGHAVQTRKAIRSCVCAPGWDAGSSCYPPSAPWPS